MVQESIAAVCYLNTIPFIYGLKSAQPNLHSNLILDVPAKCTQNFIDGKADIALIPAADLKNISSHKIITSYCIGAEREVRTVVLMSNCPVEEIENIYIDSHSHTSAQLIKILAAEKWKISPNWLELTDYSIVGNSSKKDGFMLIGDKVFEYENSYTTITDLAKEWIELTSLPFVFAVWVARNSVNDSVVTQLNNAFKLGVENLDQAIKDGNYNQNSERNLDYLTNNISFSLTDKKREGLRTFLEKVPPSSQK